MVYLHPASERSDRRTPISLVLDISQGAGLAGASGIRPFLPPLLAGALARGDTLIDFDGTDFHFLEAPGFLLGVLALAVVAYAIERTGSRRPVEIGLAAVALALGALLFAGSLAEGGRDAWPGLVAGAACAGLAYVAVSSLLAGARRRLDESASGLLNVYGDIAALALAGLAILIPPISFIALAGFAWILIGSRRKEDTKYAGLRILR